LEEACKAKEDASLKEETAEMTKMKVIRGEPWGMKKYAKEGSLFSVRNTWKVRSYMLDVAGNYSHHNKYQATRWMCQACSLQVREDQDHLTQCQGYADLVQDKDLNVDAELIDFFRLVMARREREGWD
jgi:hypothetical protein